MGLFSSKRVVQVASVVYNLAGDERERPDYMKSLVLGNIITSSQFDVAETIQSGYIKGPGIKMRNFFRWAQNNYDQIGVPKGSLISTGHINSEILADEIPHGSGETVIVTMSHYDVADFFFWADQWMRANHADIADTDWIADLNNDTGEIIITLEDEVTTYTFVPDDFQKGQTYIYANYQLNAEGSSGPIVPGPVVDLGSSPFPSMTGWTQTATSTTPRTTTLNRVVSYVSSFSDGRPNETGSTTTSTTGNWNEIHRSYERTVYQGKDPLANRLWSLKSYAQHDQVSNVTVVTSSNTTTESIGGGVTKTTVTTTNQDTLVINRKTKTDTQDITLKSYSDPQVFIYRIGSGNPTLDALVTIKAPTDQYMPFIPARIDNKFITEAPYDEFAPLAAKAYKKAVGGKFNDFLIKINENEKIADIDYAYVVFGVSMNVIENDCKDYLYRFFSLLMDNQSNGGAAYEAWRIQNAAYVASAQAHETWLAAQSVPTDPLFGTTEPVVLESIAPPSNEVSIRSDGNLATNYDIRITWQSVSEETGGGMLDSSKKVGEYWFTQGTTQNNLVGFAKAFQTFAVDQIYLNHQVSPTQWRRLLLRGFVHRNYIYEGHFVEISMKDALNDDEESGFVVPLHYDTLRSMPLTKSTQMSTACTFVIFNCYVVKKIKWYQRGIFKILLVAVIIVVSIYFPPFGASAGAGILGSGAAVGAALGFSGMIGVIVGAVANFIAAALLLKVIETGATVVFGAKLGAIIGAVAGMVAMTVGAGLMQGGNFSSALSSLSRVDNIINMANAVGGGIQKYISASINEIQQAAVKLQADYDAEKKRLDNLYAENFGYGRASFDAMRLTDYEPYVPERSDTFLARTLMTGSDNIEMTLGYVTNFADMTLSSQLS